MNFKFLQSASVIFVLCLFCAESKAAVSIPDPWLSLLKTLVNTNSSSDNPEGLDKVRNLIIPELRLLGFQTHVIDLGNRHKILLADFPNESPKLLLVGHLDTVFQKVSPFQKFGTENDRYTGPGVIDMKGGDVLMLHVLSELKKSKVSLKKIRILIDDDEEIGSVFSKPKFSELTKNMTHALVFEPGLPDGSLVESQSGVHWLELTVKGKAAHAGLEHEKGLNACVELASKITKLSQLTDYAKKLTVNVGVIEGGTKPNVVCEEAKAKIDIRYLKKSDLDQLLVKIEKIKDESSTYNPLLNLSTQAELKVIGEVANMPTEASAALLTLAKSFEEQIGHPIKAQHVGYASDGGPLAESKLNVLVGVGPYGGGMHTDREFMDINAYKERLNFNLLLIKELLKIYK